MMGEAPMGQTAQRVATYDDVLRAPEGMTAEILAGELHLSPRPGGGHQQTTTGLGADVWQQFHRRGGGPGGWVIVSEIELHLGDVLGRSDPRSVVAVPDISGWRRERMPVAPTGPGVTLAPDWVCEVLSPGSANLRRDRVLKSDLYHEAGIPWMWLVDPIGRLIEVFQHHAPGWTRVASHAGDGEGRLPPFDAVAFDVGAWWPEGAEDESTAGG
jgi:Uma2 family endonuclease